MKVRLEDIPEEGLSVHFEMTVTRPEDLGPDVARIIEAPAAELRLTPLDGVIFAKGRGRAGLELACSRCLEPFLEEVDLDISLVFQPAPDGGAREEVQLAADDMDACFIENDELDLGQALLDEISLALDMAPLCQSDCPGLCPVCGKHLREGDCGCRKRQTDPRLAKLAELKLPPQ